jgi:hypothetical protein
VGGVGEDTAVSSYPPSFPFWPLLRIFSNGDTIQAYQTTAVELAGYVLNKRVSLSIKVDLMNMALTTDTGVVSNLSAQLNNVVRGHQQI